VNVRRLVSIVLLGLLSAGLPAPPGRAATPAAPAPGVQTHEGRARGRPFGPGESRRLSMG
jgi:hypothetical protein